MKQLPRWDWEPVHNRIENLAMGAIHLMARGVVAGDVVARSVVPNVPMGSGEAGPRGAGGWVAAARAPCEGVGRRGGRCGRGAVLQGAMVGVAIWAVLPLPLRNKRFCFFLTFRLMYQDILLL